MKPVYVIANNIISPLGDITEKNFSLLRQGVSSVRLHEAGNRSPIPFYASLFPETFWQHHHTTFTKFEYLLAQSVNKVLEQASVNPAHPKTGLILSSTKGNISLLEENAITPQLKAEISFTQSAKKIAKHFGFINTPVVISHACISGLVALITAKRMLEAGLYENVVVAGADIITRFILSGFQSFQAVSDAPCKPFDANRNGINLGEAAAAIVLSVHKPLNDAPILLAGGAVSNDANHISGPSRTGQELFFAISNAMQEGAVSAADIGFVSLHGTATVYNDDMESKAITLAELQQVPVNSIKGYYGHTLGAAGLLETVISICSLQENIMIPTKGYSTPGTAQQMNVCTVLQPIEQEACLKTASGFGGCNAAIVLKKQ